MKIKIHKKLLAAYGIIAGILVIVGIAAAVGSVSASTAGSASCYDSDGLNINSAGYVSLSSPYAKSGIVYKDTCVTSQVLREGVCGAVSVSRQAGVAGYEAKNIIREKVPSQYFIYYNCPTGCKQGACLQPGSR